MTAWVADHEADIVSSDLLRTELLRVTRRCAPHAMTRARAVLDAITLLTVPWTTFERAAELDPELCRSLDAMHLASALELGDELRGLVTYDGRLTQAAELHGITVIAPATSARARYSEPDKAPFGLQHEDAWPVRFWEVDASMAAMITLLGAVDAGLGGWFFGLATGEPELLAHFGVPDGIRPIGVIGLGYHADDEAPVGSGTTRRRRPLHDQVHRNHW